MSTYSAHFEYLDECKIAKNGYSYPATYDWFMPTVKTYSDECDEVRLCCLLDDDEAVASLARYSARTDAQTCIDKDMQICTGPFDSHLAYELTHVPFDSEGKVKWLSVSLKRAGKTVLSIDKYGKVFFMQGISKKDIDYLTQIMLGFKFSFYVWEDERSGTEVDIDAVFVNDEELGDVFDSMKDGLLL